jgi:hypothetical protein
LEKRIKRRNECGMKEGYMMYNRMFFIIFILLGSAVLYRFRYKLISNVLKNEVLQKAIVRSFMSIPFVRKVFFEQAF